MKNKTAEIIDRAYDLARDECVWSPDQATALIEIVNIFSDAIESESSGE